MYQLLPATASLAGLHGAAVAELAAWEIGVVAFAFVGVILVASFLLEHWGVGLHA